MLDRTMTYQEEIVAWHEARVATLSAPDGWLRLAGLFWLEEGTNTFGSDMGNDVVFPEGKAPAFMGSLLLENGRIFLQTLPNVEITYQDEPVTKLELLPDMAAGGPTIVHHGLLSWFIIRRDDRYAVRLKDLESPYWQQFQGIDTFPFDPAWRIEAQFEPYDPPRQVAEPNVLGTINMRHCPGALVFEIAGETYRLDVLNSLEYPSIVFADATTAKETYGGGRFLKVDPIDPNGTNYVDFNKAINPPCAFSPFATCPLPPAQNRLKVAIPAGEKKYHYD